VSDESIEVILNEIKHLREDIIDIKEGLKAKCDTCVNAAKFRERLRSQWFHILALWSSIVGLGAIFYNHITGK
jgi:hypothetical protein